MVKSENPKKLFDTLDNVNFPPILIPTLVYLTTVEDSGHIDSKNLVSTIPGAVRPGSLILLISFLLLVILLLDLGLILS